MAFGGGEKSEKPKEVYNFYSNSRATILMSQMSADLGTWKGRI